MRLLCIEDETALREDIVEYLRMQSYEVDEAENGEKALEQLSRHRYDLVLCDIKMPSMDGYEVLQQVRRDNQLIGTPFIFLTAFNEQDNKTRAHKTGCDAYLTKPIDFSLLDEILKSNIQRQRQRSFLSDTTLQSLQSHVVSVLDKELNGALHETSLRISALREDAPLLSPQRMDAELAQLEKQSQQQYFEFHMLHSALTLQTQQKKIERQPVTIAALMQQLLGVDRHADATQQLDIDLTLVHHALIGLISRVPSSYLTADSVQVATDHRAAMFTVYDHPRMADEDGFFTIDASTNLTTLSEVTRRRLVALLFAMQVAHAHGGTVSIALWPNDLLAVRLLLPNGHVVQH